MQIKFNIKSKLAYLLSLILLYTPLSAFAKEVNLYDQPNTNAKVVGKVDLSIGIVPIFTPQNGDWMKVGDPRNGNTGWIKSTDLNGANNAVTFSQQIINDGNGPHTFQFMQYGQPPQPMTEEERKKLMKQMQLQHQNIQQTMQQQMLEMQREFDEMQHGWPFMHGPHMPMIMPVVFVPMEESQTQVKKPKETVQHPQAANPAIVSAPDTPAANPVTNPKQP